MNLLSNSVIITYSLFKLNDAGETIFKSPIDYSSVEDIYVRAKRSGRGSGRTYTITATAEDEHGNSALESFEVSVANNKGRN